MVQVLNGFFVNALSGGQFAVACKLQKWKCISQSYISVEITLCYISQIPDSIKIHYPTIKNFLSNHYCITSFKPALTTLLYIDTSFSSVSLHTR